MAGTGACFANFISAQSSPLPGNSPLDIYNHDLVQSIKAHFHFFSLLQHAVNFLPLCLISVSAAFSSHLQAGFPNASATEKCIPQGLGIACILVLAFNIKNKSIDSDVVFPPRVYFVHSC